MIVDIVLVIILVLAAFIGYKKGLIQMLISFVGTMLAVLIAYFLGSTTKEFLIKHFALDKTINESVILKLQNISTNAAATENLQSNGYDIGGIPLPDVLKSALNDFVAEKTTAVINSTASILTGFIMTAIAFALTFLIALIIIKIISKIIDGVTSLPVIKQFNRLGGMIFSVLGVLIVLNVVFVLMMSFMSLDKFSSIDNMLKASYVGRYLLIKYNPILLLFSAKF